MKQHYNKCIGAVLVLLLIAAYFVNVSKKTDSEVAEKPKAPATQTKGGPAGSSAGSPAAPADEKTMASIQQSLAKREYNISFDTEKKALQSPNRKQNLRTYYKPGEYTIQNRIDSAGYNFSLKLTNEGIFADGKKILSPQTNAVLENLDNKLVIKHKGFSEEFINNEEGVRQNFIIDHAPVGTRELQVKLSAKGLKVDDLQNNELHFYAGDKDGNVENQLVYKDIKCWDKNGTILPATLRFEDNLIALSVNVQGAAYPVTIDPIIINGNPGNANVTLETNQAGAQAGYAVSSAGDVNGDGYSDVIVGAPFFDKGESNEGVVFVYHGSASGVGINPAIVLEGNQKEAQFGTSAASAGDINKDGFSDIIIGAPLYDKIENNEGAAFVYYGSASGINNTATILESNQPEAKFGRNIDGLGDVNGDGFSDVVVGAPLFDKGKNEEGAAFIFHGSAQGIATIPAIVLESNQATAYMGQSVAAAGDINGDGFNDVLVGSTHYDKGQNDEGVVFVYHGSAAGVGANAVAVLEINQANAAFGWAVSTAGDVNGDGYSDIIIGSYLYDNNQSNEGAAFIYHGSAQGIKTAAASKLESNQIDARQGISVACAGDVNGDGYSDILVGVWQYDKGESNEGAVILHYGASTGISATPASTIEGNQANAAMGWSVKSAGDVNGDGYSDIIVGANMYDDGHADEGAAFVWMGIAEGVSKKSFRLECDNEMSGFGYTVGNAGDFNGDGYDDLVVGAHAFDNGQLDEGGAFVFYGSVTGIIPNATILECNKAGAGFGIAVGAAGDLNGDGYEDLIVGATGYSNGQTNEGRMFVYHGSPQGISNNAAFTYENDVIDAWLGSSVAGAGDINGDGYGDAVVGAMNYTNGQKEEGQFHILFGSANGLTTAGMQKVESNVYDTGLGNAVAGAGDLNADGFSDVLVGAHAAGGDDAGAAYVYYGSKDGLKLNLPTTLTGTQAQENLGWSVSSAGDINGDGFFDVIIGMPYYGTDGAASLYYGSATGININSKILLEGSLSGIGDFIGNSVSTAGDLNGDGYSDLVVGAPWYYDSNSDRWTGAALVYLGSSNGLNTTPTLIESDKTNTYDFVGWSVSGGGDFNGDGFSDLVLGAPNFDVSQEDNDAVFIHYGNCVIGQRNNLRLYNSNLTTPINQSQKAKNDFGAGLYAKSFLGKNKAKLVWETQAKGQGFSKGANNVITNSTMSTGSQNAYAGLGLKGVELKNVIAKQGPSTKVRVRVKYDPALALTGQVYGPWRYLPAYLLGNGAAPAPEDLVDDMSETVSRKAKPESVANDIISIYPNPASDVLTVETFNPEIISQLQLFTTNGKLVRKVAQKTIDVRGLESGMYILVIGRKDGSQTSHKVAISH